ncbi:MAG TPA: von Willebrand factor type A domain-containing protein [Kofleriaceae bacterium]|nr:von Willebrand factor type A domain-containing protein [Kofleriaceae bacterium]
MQRTLPVRVVMICLSLGLALAAASCKKGKESAETAGPAARDQLVDKPNEAPATTKAAEAGGAAAGGAVAATPAPVDQARAFSARAHGRADTGIAREGGTGTESYEHREASAWVSAGEDALSTFAVDVDTGSYTIFRKKVLAGEQVPPDAVRVEEFVNFFRYADAPPADGSPFAIHTELAPSPWRRGAHLLRVALKGREVAPEARKPAHLVFLVDVSGSMADPDKLPLVKRSLRILVESLQRVDTVSLVTYAGSTRVVLEPTGLDRRADILRAIDELDAGGSTAMASGLDLAYQQATRHLGRDSISRVIVLTDGDANVGPSSFEDMLAIIAGRASEGVTLSTIGFGMGNYKDSVLEQLADKGDGNYFYVDSIDQARRVFHEQLGGTLEVIARDAKVQVEFDPHTVSRYRLMGYENRDVADQDFRNDKVDGGEIGSGHAVTALYELELRRAPAGDGAGEGRVAVVRVRAKQPRGNESGEWSQPVDAAGARRSFDVASADLRFAAAVAGAAEILRGSPAAEGWRMVDARAMARAAAGESPERQELVSLLGRLAGEAPRAATLAR